MSALPIPAEAVERAARAFQRRDDLKTYNPDATEAAVREFLEAMGVQVEWEWRTDPGDTWESCSYEDAMRYLQPAKDGELNWGEVRRRLVSRWLPVEQEKP